MADDFPKTLSKTAGVPKTHFLNENFAWILSSSVRIRRCCTSFVGGIIICILFLVLARFAIGRKSRYRVFNIFLSRFHLRSNRLSIVTGIVILLTKIVFGILRKVRLAYSFSRCKAHHVFI